jgi:hypothetical protein
MPHIDYLQRGSRSMPLQIVSLADGSCHRDVGQNGRGGRAKRSRIP